MQLGGYGNTTMDRLSRDKHWRGVLPMEEYSLDRGLRLRECPVRCLRGGSARRPAYAAPL